MTSKASIAAWLAEYHSDLLGRELTLAERMLAEEVLLDFLLDEPQLNDGKAGHDAQHALQALRTLTRPEAAAASDRLAETVQAHLRDLAGRLERQEHANMIMREHLAMLTTPVADRSD